MRAVNLIPREDRRGSSAPGRSGGGVYGLLGILTVAVVVLAAYVLAGNQVTKRKSEVAKVEQQATAAEAEASQLAPYRQFADLGKARVATIQSLAASRFDWASTMRQMSRVLPADVWLTSFVGTVAPGVGVSSAGGSGDSSGLRGALAAPAVELSGCTVNQREVSRVLVTLRRMRGVQRVSLAASEKADVTAATAPSTPAGPGGQRITNGDCRNGSSRFPKFSLVIFYDALPVATLTPQPGESAQGATGTPAGQAQTAAQTTTTPGAPK